MPLELSDVKNTEDSNLTLRGVGLQLDIAFDDFNCGHKYPEGQEAQFKAFPLEDFTLCKQAGSESAPAEPSRSEIPRPAIPSDPYATMAIAEITGDVGMSIFIGVT